MYDNISLQKSRLVRDNGENIGQSRPQLKRDYNTSHPLGMLGN
jgi:hypothetical protein